ncbi:MAG: 3-keto-5-aminohexanoate cleavage protein [Deltaproteobacteria bacterium]|nr:3-keto-5-aminohexanoate cleavage protein [Deltaproteobacteria bacterium]
MNKRIITAAITGSIHTPTMSQHLPVTPDQIVDETVRAYEAGAAVAHIHARNPETGMPSADVNLYREIVTKIKSKCNIILCITTGGGVGMTVEERVAAIPQLKPELASFNFGSLNFALFSVLDTLKEFKFAWEHDYLAMTEDFILPNTFKTMARFGQVFQENLTLPELEVYDVGMLNNIAFMLERGHIKKPIYMQFVMGILGGIPAGPDNLIFMYNTARALIGDFNWSVCAAGRHQFNMCTLSLVIGGNARVGLEDNLYLEKGVKAKSNAQQVEKIVRIARELGLEPATPDEARQMLGLKGLDKVAY